MIHRAVWKVIRKRGIDGRADTPGENEGGGELRVLKVKQGTIFHPALVCDDDQGWGEGLSSLGSGTVAWSAG